MEHGYSGTPLAKKLGIKEGCILFLVNPPKHYFNLFSDLPENITVLKTPQPESVDVIHLFCTTVSEFEAEALELKPYLKKTGMLWVIWPKGTSTIPTNLKRDAIREFLLVNGLVDTKVCAVDADWSGLKFMFRLKDR